MSSKRHAPPSTQRSVKKARLHELLLDNSQTKSNTSFGRGNDDPFVGKNRLKDATAVSEPFVKIPHAKFPASAFNSVELGITSEDGALDDLLARCSPLSAANDYVSFTLENFEVYRPFENSSEDLDRYSGTLASLNELRTLPGDAVFCFDGTICHGETRHHVRGVPFSLLNVDGYSTDSPQLIDVHIQSKAIQGKAVFYRLGRPSTRYAPYHTPFLWLANFTKHFVDFLDTECQVTLAHFQSTFHRFICQRYLGMASFDEWLQQHPRTDFRQVVAAHFEYLWKEATDVSEQARSHPLWSEVDAKSLRAVKEQPKVESKTVVTAFVYRCFQNMYFSKHLKIGYIDAGVHKTVVNHAKLLNLHVLPLSATGSEQAIGLQWCQHRSNTVEAGHVVILRRDHDDESLWKDDPRSKWLAYVQGIKRDSVGDYLHVIWLYRPSDTICDAAFYPFENELFFSDHCNCGDPKIRLADVEAILDVSFLNDQSSPSRASLDLLRKPFIRQVYITPDEEADKDAAFITLKQDHFVCGHVFVQRDAERVEKFYPPGTTALIKDIESHYLEPVIILSHRNQNDVVVRHFKRRSDFDSLALPNEILNCSQTSTICASYVIRYCHVRAFTVEAVREGSVPAPYSYGGAADCWCLTGRLVSTPHEDKVEPINMASDFIQGFDPSTSPVALQGLSLFSGGGSFDRGLEEAGAVQIRWAIEMAKEPMHTYRANLKEPEKTALYLGSVNDYISQALEGKTTSSFIASIGEVMFISGGSPCKDFSRANQNKRSKRAASLDSASLVASVLTFINVYCPYYAVLENVYDMCRAGGQESKETVFSQVVATLVAMGYQVQTFLSDSWTHGSSQKRSRLFIVATAPGLQPPERPPQTHCHPPRTVSRAIGRTKSNVKFGVRHLDHDCPFGHVSARAASQGLPQIETGSIRTVVPFPDHRLVNRDSTQRTFVMKWIPKFPQKSGYMAAVKSGYMPKALQALFKTRSKEWRAEKSNAYKRMDPDSIWPTIRTSGHPDDSRHGACVHWEEPRTMTVMEARRAQSIPDHEVLIGNVSQQWLVVGNGVDRKASAAMGLSLRQAVLNDQTQAIIQSRGSHQTFNGSTRNENDQRYS